MPQIPTETLVGLGLLGLLALAYSYTTGTTSPSAAASAAFNLKKKTKKAVSSTKAKSPSVDQIKEKVSDKVKPKGEAVTKSKPKQKTKTVAPQTSHESFAEVTKHHQENSVRPVEEVPSSQSEAEESPAAANISGKKKKGKKGKVATDNGKTLAEKLVKKPESTPVDDMLPPAAPLARVMKVTQPSPNPAPALPPSLTTIGNHQIIPNGLVPGFEADYDDDSTPKTNTPRTSPQDQANASSTDEDDGWEKPKKGAVVGGNSNLGSDVAGGSNGAGGSVTTGGVGKSDETGLGGSWSSVTKGGKSVSTPNRFAALSMPSGPMTIRAPSASASTGTSKPKAQTKQQQTASLEPTKLQKKNAAATEKKKLAKEAEEKDRLDRLAKYRKEQEREKIAQVSSAKKNGGKVLGNGMNPSVAQDGRLIWE